MRGGNNLVIGVRADTSKLKTDLALTKAELSDVAKELNSKAKVANALPDTDPNKKRLISDLDEISKRHGDVADKVRGLTGRLKEADAANRKLNESGTGKVASGYKEAATHARSLSDTIKSMFGLSRAVDADTATGHVKKLHGEVKNLGGGLLEVNGAFAKMHRALQGIQDLGMLGHFGKEAFGGVKEVAEGLAATRNTSLGTGFSTDFVATVENLLKETGKEGDGTNPRGALIQWMGAWGDARTMALTARREQERQAAQDRIDKDSDPEGYAKRQKEKARLDAAGGPEVTSIGSNPFKALGIDPLRYSAGPAGAEQAFSDSLQKLKQMRGKDAGGAARIGALILGEDDISNWGKVADKIGSERGGMRDITNRYRDAGELPTKDDFSKLDEYQAAMGKLNRETDALKRSAVVSFFPQISFGIRGAAAGLKIFSEAFNPLIREFGTWIGSHKDDIKKFALDSATWLKAVALDIAGLFKGQAPETDFVKGFVKAKTQVTEAVTFIKAAFSGLMTFMDGIAVRLNSIFGTSFFSGRGVLLGAVAFQMAGGFRALSAGVLLASGAFKALRLVLSFFLLNPVGLALLAIGLVALTIYQNWEKIGPIFWGLWDGLKGFGLWIKDQFWKFWTDPIGYIKDALAGLLTWATEKMQQFTAGIESVAKAAVAAAKSIGGAISGGTVGNGTASPSGYTSSNPASAWPQATFGAIPGQASGGMIRGPGGPTDDKVPLWGSNGEFVVNAAATSRNLPLLHAINSGAKYAMGGLVNVARFAMGGMVGFSPSIPNLAGGGLVGGGGSYGTVNLTIGGQTSTLHVTNRSGYDDVVRAARSEQRTKAGATPSWYGS